MNRNVYGENYTMRLDEIIDQIWIDDHENELGDLEDINTWREARARIKERISYASTQIFNFDYPCYGGQEERTALQEHILKTYYTRNICSSSFIRWLIYLEDRLHDIMPKYVEIYNAQLKLIASDIFNPYHIEETKRNTYDKSNSSKDESTSNTNNSVNSSSSSATKGTDDTLSKEVTKFSNTPQALASAVESGDSIPLNYLSSMGTTENDSKNKYDSSANANESSNANTLSSDERSYNSSEQRFENFIRDTKGNLSKLNNAQLIKDYEDVILNIEKMISDELKDLFYLIY